MKKEEKQLLLKDLCARLPYGVKVQDELGRINKLVIGNADLIRLYYDDFSIYSEKSLSLPYLRPMSSMTEEERKEIGNLIKENRPNPYGIINNKGIDNLLFSVSVTSGVLVDWLNAHHLDFRGLIEKGLALEAPKGMYSLNK